MGNGDRDREKIWLYYIVEEYQQPLANTTEMVFMIMLFMNKRSDPYPTVWIYV